MATPNGRSAIHVRKGREEGRERKGTDSLGETFKYGTCTKLKKKKTRDYDSVQANRKKAKIEWDILSLPLLSLSGLTLLTVLSRVINSVPEVMQVKIMRSLFKNVIEGSSLQKDIFVCNYSNSIKFVNFWQTFSYSFSVCTQYCLYAVWPVSYTHLTLPTNHRV